MRQISIIVSSCQAILANDLQALGLIVCEVHGPSTSTHAEKHRLGNLSLFRIILKS